MVTAYIDGREYGKIVQFHLVTFIKPNIINIIINFLGLLVSILYSIIYIYIYNQYNTNF